MQDPLLPRRPARPVRAHPPRRHLRRRLRVAARQGVAGDPRLPRGRERLHRGPHRAPRRAAAADLRRDQGPHQGDRPVGARADRRLLVLQPLDRGPAVRRQLPLPRRRLPTTGRRRVSTPRSTSPASRSCSTSTSSPRGTTFFSLGTASISPDGNLLAFSTDTVGNERFLLRVKDLRTGELLADEVPNTLGPAVWDLHGTVLFYTTVDDSWRPDKVWRHELGHPVARRRRRPPRAGRAVLDLGRPHPQRPAARDRLGLEDHHGVPRPRRRRPRRRVPGRRPAPAGRGVRRRARRHPRRGPAARAAQRGRRELRARHGADRRHLGRPVGAAAPPRPGGPARGRRRVRDPPGGQPAQQRPHPAAGDRARPRTGWATTT